MFISRWLKSAWGSCDCRAGGGQIFKLAHFYPSGTAKKAVSLQIIRHTSRNHQYDIESKFHMHFFNNDKYTDPDHPRTPLLK